MGWVGEKTNPFPIKTTSFFIFMFDKLFLLFFGSARYCENFPEENMLENKILLDKVNLDFGADRKKNFKCRRCLFNLKLA